MAAAVAEYLASAAGGSLGTFGNAPATIFVDDMPRTPDELLSVFSTGGPEADSGMGYDYPTFQLQARGPLGGDPRPAVVKLKAAYSQLHGLAAVTLPGGIYVVYILGVQSEPVRVGPDENGRHRYSLNFRCEVRSVTEHRD